MMDRGLNSQAITLRKFPYPYRAAFAICSDVDNTPSLEMYLTVMDYLNGSTETGLGKGLGLETGNSFWFFNNTDSWQLSYFEGAHTVETEFAPYCRELLASGHIDVLHTYGNFDQGGFTRRYAEMALNELIRLNAKIKVWVNHGSASNAQNLGFVDSYNGARLKTGEYHNDLLNGYGVRFAWTGRMTHILGQEARQTANVTFKNMLQKLLFATKYRRLKEQMFDAENRLMIEAELQDGNRVWDFQRWVNAWGRQRILDINDLCFQLKSSNIDRLIKNEGYLVVYTHICENLNSSTDFPGILKRNLENIARHFRECILLVTTTSRLLQYAEMWSLLAYESTIKDNVTIIRIAPAIAFPGKNIELDESTLQGLTFYCRSPETVRIIFKGKEVNTRQNPPDHSGRPSISIPWNPLEYPRN